MDGLSLEKGRVKRYNANSCRDVLFKVALHVNTHSKSHKTLEAESWKTKLKSQSFYINKMLALAEYQSQKGVFNISQL